MLYGDGKIAVKILDPGDSPYWCMEIAQDSERPELVRIRIGDVNDSNGGHSIALPGGAISDALGFIETVNRRYSE